VLRNAKTAQTVSNAATHAPANKANLDTLMPVMLTDRQGLNNFEATSSKNGILSDLFAHIVIQD
jgi:hypothetical protein